MTEINESNILQKLESLRKSNNKSSRDFIIICKIDQETDLLKSSVEKWLLSKLSNIINPAVYDGSGLNQYAWNIMVDSCNADEDNETEILFAVHLTWYGGVHMDTDCLIYLEEESTPPQLDANVILEHLVDVPNFITGIGVSAVSSKFMAKTWWEYIEEGAGYMSKHMWACMPDGEWLNIREKSFNFGWDNYPPPN